MTYVQNIPTMVDGGCLNRCCALHAFVSVFALFMVASFSTVWSFQPALARHPVSNRSRIPSIPYAAPARCSLSASMSNTISVSLSKPLGLILEENDTGSGVYVADVTDSGSAYASGIPVGAVVAVINGKDVATASLEVVMEVIDSTSDPVQVEFRTRSVEVYQQGTTVSITILAPNHQTQIVSAKVGDNLRQTLLSANVEVYAGIKQKLGNCGGAGQCTFCAFDFLDSEASDNNAAWGPATERSDYESNKLAKFPIARLACLHTVLGPATIQKTQR
jgi:ferredoxin